MSARRLIALAMVLALVGAVAGCKKGPDAPALRPEIAPPVIGSEGVLKAGMDLDYPPFAGVDGGAEAGIDVDVAAAIAERLGLRLELVDVKAEEMASALNDGTVDIMLGATPVTEAVLADVSSAGSYLIDALGVFAVIAEGSEVATVTIDQLPGKRVAAQEGSPAFWELQAEFGEGFVLAYPSLREAIAALAAGEADYVVGDAAVGAYIARDFADAESGAVAFVGQLASGLPLGVAVKKDATELELAVRSALDALAADGTLDTIRSKWLGDLPDIQIAVQ